MNFPKFVAGNFKIITDFAGTFGAGLAVKMNKLAQEGVLLIKGVREGEKVEKYFLVFRGQVIAPGKKIAKDIREIVKKGVNQ